MRTNNVTTFPVLSDKSVIVTGGASGLGREASILFAEAGAKVIVADYNLDGAEETVATIKQAGGKAIAVHTDVSDSESVQNMVATAVETYGRLDGAFNNAAAAPDNALTSEFDEDYWDKLMKVDLKGVALCMKYEIKQFLAQGDGGAIVNTASVSGIRPQPFNPAYVSAKHGVIGLTKVAAVENGPHNIRVNAIAPGAIDTPMLHDALEALGTSGEEYAPMISLLNRFGSPREIAQPALWLLSDAASYVTSTVIAVDAGYTGR